MNRTLPGWVKREAERAVYDVLRARFGTGLYRWPTAPDIRREAGCTMWLWGGLLVALVVGIGTCAALLMMR